MISTLDHLIVAVKDLEEAEKNYKKIFGADPVWRGEHKALGTTNSIFNFKNTYFELLAAKGSGLGAELVNNSIAERGDGLLGIVFGTDDINQTTNSLKEIGYEVSNPVEGEGEIAKTKKSENGKIFSYLKN